MANTSRTEIYDRLHRVFDAIIFDWDGTAVPDRKTPVPKLITALEDNLRQGAICVIVTGTNINNLLNQGIDTLDAKAKKSLFVGTNRGSEVWGFHPDGKIKLIYKREATPDENTALDRAAMDLQKHAEGYGLKTEIISDRLNRRKVDLIPEPKWADPKKAEFGKLLNAVNHRLLDAGVFGGVSELIRDSYRISQEAGLERPRITSDIKHIEIGLTDKSDSVRWVFQNLIRRNTIPLRRVAALGDEFGSIGGIQGSDALLRIPEIQDAQFFSVGVEPEGVLPWVTALGGGPERFIQFLDEQAQIRSAAHPSDDMLAWQVIQEGFEPSREREMETLFAIANGTMGVRATSDFPVPAAQPDLFIAGIYDQKAATLPYSEVEFHTSSNRKSCETEIVPFPSPFPYQLRIADTELSSDSEMKTHSRTLNLKEGIYVEDHAFEDSLGRRSKIQSLRCASLSDPHLLLQRIRIESENYSAPVVFDCSSNIKEYETLYPHLDILRHDTSGTPPEVLLYRTKGSQVECAILSQMFSAKIAHQSTVLKFELNPGEAIEIYRMISVFTSRSTKEPFMTAKDHILGFSITSFEEELELHKAAWKRFWAVGDVTFDQVPELTQAQRFNLYHLRSAANHDPQTSIPAKALTGRAYEGHVFWDTEIFMFPFYLYTEPTIAKNLLLYRYNTLDGAKKRASAKGYQGACYAWESTVSGEDVTPTSILVVGAKEEIPIFTGTQQIHVTADVAYAVWKYWDATLDSEFLRDVGAELLVETARFWASRVSLERGTYHILDVVGPDEYHHGVNDNAYTNWMARFNLEKAVWACAHLKEHHVEFYREFVLRIQLCEEEYSTWRKIVLALFIPKPDERGVIEQFRGFHDLRRVDVPEHERHRAPVSRLFNWSEINGARLVKQADVLMLPFLFPEAFPNDVIAANYQYYEPMTDHGSSLSPCVHAAIAARIGRFDEAKKYWDRSLNFDLENSMSNTGLGVHVAAMGGTWQALVFHLLGIELSARGPGLMRTSGELDALGFSGVELNLTYRGKTYPIRLNSRKRVAA